MSYSRSFERYLLLLGFGASLWLGMPAHAQEKDKHTDTVSEALSLWSQSKLKTNHEDAKALLALCCSMHLKGKLDGKLIKEISKQTFYPDQIQEDLADPAALSLYLLECSRDAKDPEFKAICALGAYAAAADPKTLEAEVRQLTAAGKALPKPLLEALAIYNALPEFLDSAVPSETPDPEDTKQPKSGDQVPAESQHPFWDKLDQAIISTLDAQSSDLISMLNALSKVLHPVGITVECACSNLELKSYKGPLGNNEFRGASLDLAFPRRPLRFRNVTAAELMTYIDYAYGIKYSTDDQAGVITFLANEDAKRPNQPQAYYHTDSISYLRLAEPTLFERFNNHIIQFRGQITAIEAEAAQSSANGEAQRLALNKFTSKSGSFSNDKFVLWSNGPMSMDMPLPAGEYTLRVSASANDVGQGPGILGLKVAQMINLRDIRPDPTSVELKFTHDGQPLHLELLFTNDYHDGGKKLDRNMTVHSVEIIPVVKPPVQSAAGEAAPQDLVITMNEVHFRLSAQRLKPKMQEYLLSLGKNPANNTKLLLRGRISSIAGDFIELSEIQDLILESSPAFLTLPDNGIRIAK